MSSGTALVTGGARRIGKAVVERLAEAGFAVAIHCNASRGEAEALAAALATRGLRAAVVQADLSQPDAATALIAAATHALGPCRLLVNNAALFEPDAAQTFSAETLDRHIAVNLRAPLLLAQAFAAALPAGEDGLIVNIIDQRVLRPNPQFFSYTVSKSALWAATQTLAQALAPRIRVNAVGPGPTLANAFDGPEGVATEARGVPLERQVQPNEIAEAVLYLARARSVTGQMIAVDGGQHLGWRTPDVVG